MIDQIAAVALFLLCLAPLAYPLLAREAPRPERVRQPDRIRRR